MLLSLSLLPSMHSIGQQSHSTMLPLLHLFVDALFPTASIIGLIRTCCLPRSDNQPRPALLRLSACCRRLAYNTACCNWKNSTPLFELPCCTYRSPTANPVRQEAMRAATGSATGRDTTAKSTPIASEPSQPSSQPAAQKASQPAAKLDESLFTLGNPIRLSRVTTSAMHCSMLSNMWSVYVWRHDSHRFDVLTHDTNTCLQLLLHAC